MFTCGPSLLTPVIAAGAAASTWNPSDSDGSWTFSNGNKTAASNSGGSSGGVRGTAGKTSGKYYFEVKANSGTYPYYGVASSNTSIILGAAVNATTGVHIYYRQDGNWWSNASSGSGPAWSVGDVIGFAVDFGAKTLYIYKNNALIYTWTWTATTDLYPVSYHSNGGASTTGTLATTTPDLIYAPPAGFSAWG